MATAKKVKRRKLNIKALIIILLIIYLIIMLLYTFFTMPIKNIYIYNTTILTDNEIIEAAGIKAYPSIFKLSSKKLEEKILTLDLVNSVNIKKTLTGKLIIDIKEAIPLFYNRNTENVVLSNTKQVENSSKYLGIPTLINYVPSDLLNAFIESFKEIDQDIIAMINEIEYNPDLKIDSETGETIEIDKERFLLRMNDSNHIYVNVINMERLNDYKNVIKLVGESKGTLYLDSYNNDNSIFTEFENNLDNNATEGNNDIEN